MPTSASIVGTDGHTYQDFVFFDDFNSDNLNTTLWGQFSRPSGDDYAYSGSGQKVWWQPSHVKTLSSNTATGPALVSSSTVKLSTYWEKSGQGTPAAPINMLVNAGIGVKSEYAFTYGKVEVCARRDFKIIGNKLVFVCLNSANWPNWGEMDFYEDGNDGPGNNGDWVVGLNDTTDLAYHYGTRASPQQHITYVTGYDMTTWNVWGFEWSPGHVNFTLNGASVYAVSSNVVGSGPLEVSLQQEYEGSYNGTIPATDPLKGDTCDAEIDWVVAWNY